MTWKIRFDTGTLVVEVPEETRKMAESMLTSRFVWDGRICAFRASAMVYRWLVMRLLREKVDFLDEARNYTEVSAEFRFHRTPYGYQEEALRAWEKNGCCGVVVLPTGAGKSFVAQMAIARKGRSALIVTPTLDLVSQWHMGLEHAFGFSCGLVGGGVYDIQDITVTTYDSAYLHMEKLGSRFGIIVFDEVHHLPSQTYALSALQCIAPYRLGLTATPEREDSAYSYEQLVGPIVYRQSIRELAGQTLSTYETVQYEVELTEDERMAYDAYRSCYLDFIRVNHIRIGTPDGWSEFLRMSSRSREGREALHAHRMQRRITQRCDAKLRLMADLLSLHRKDRTIIFTADNETVYQVSRDFLIPAITHLSPMKERKMILERFAAGTFPVVVTSKVLNEGVDIPSANVAIVLSGSGSVREHVQRLGRILRSAKGKTAVLYELVAKDTTEGFTSERRRKHDAF